MKLTGLLFIDKACYMFMYSPLPCISNFASALLENHKHNVHFQKANLRRALNLKINYKPYSVLNESESKQYRSIEFSEKLEKTSTKPLYIV